MRAESPIVTDSSAAPAKSGWVVIDPRYRRRFARRGLLAAADFIDLPGEVVSGHADRHVVRVVLGRGLSRIVAFLKREHRVPRRERLRSFCAGFGWASKSEREVRVLTCLRQAGVRAPRWLAYGEDGRGRAFALVREITGAADLRSFLKAEPRALCRRALARRLGRMLARVHAAGFDCPDLASKHVLIRPRGQVPFLIDWQRAVWTRKMRWPIRIRELALLHATLADDLATPRERLACLQSYLRAALGGRPALRPWVKLVVGRAAQLLRRRAIQDLRRPPLSGGAQRLRWVTGESLVVTRSVWRGCRGRLPDWLIAAANTDVEAPRDSTLLWRGRTVILRQFPAASDLRLWWNWLRGRHEIAAGPRLGGILFQRQRCGFAGPRPLAFGQRPDGGSFILLLPTGEMAAALIPDQLSERG
jgi:hypothetical protein